MTPEITIKFHVDTGPCTLDLSAAQYAQGKTAAVNDKIHQANQNGYAFNLGNKIEFFLCERDARKLLRKLTKAIQSVDG